MKSYKTFKTEVPETLEEALSISKLKKLKLVSDEEFSKFLRVMKKLDAEKPVPLKDKDIIMKVFNELVSAIVSDQALLQRIAKRNDGDEEEKK